MAHDKRDYGDGGIDERGKDRWRLRYRVGGKRFTKTVRGSIGEARKELRRLLKSGDDGQHVAPDKTTLAEWVGRWVALLERRGPDSQDTAKRKRGLVNARTLERYEELLRLHAMPTLGARPIQQIRPAEIDTLYTRLEQRLSPRTVHHLHVVLGACLNVAVRKELIARNPVARAEAPSLGESDAGTVLDQDQLTALVQGFRNSTLFPIVSVAAFTGARRNEILALRWSDLDVSNKTLTIKRAVEQTKRHGRGTKEPKTARGTRTITIDDGLIALLAKVREKQLRIKASVPDGVDPVDLSLVKLPSDALMFPSFAGNDLDFTRLRNPYAVTKEFRRKARGIGFPKLRFHDLRGTHETLLLDAGVPVHVVAARCGHDPAVLLRSYAKRTKKADTSAAAVIGALSKDVLGG
jgi:integrase